MLSYWEKESLLAYDFAIVGGGITGFSTAISLKERFPNAQIVLFEKGILPSGASSKNAGFACFGSLTEMVDDLSYMSESELLELISWRLEGLEMLKKRFGEAAIGFQATGGYELIGQQEIAYLDKIDAINHLIAPLFGQKMLFKTQNESIGRFGFSKKFVKSLIYNNLEGKVHTGKLNLALWDMAARLGIQVRTGAQVNQIEDSPTHVSLFVNQENLEFKAQKVFVCTNAFTKKLYPDLPLEPGRGLVLVTKPLDNLAFDAVFHYQLGYYYFRTDGQRLILGGGRNLDFETERTTAFAINEKIFDQLNALLAQVILPESAYEIDYAWTGIMAFGPNKRPLVLTLSPRVYAGVRLGGMGVAIGTKLGHDLAHLC